MTFQLTQPNLAALERYADLVGVSAQEFLNAFLAEFLVPQFADVQSGTAEPFLLGVNSSATEEEADARMRGTRFSGTRFLARSPLRQRERMLAPMSALLSVPMRTGTATLSETQSVPASLGERFRRRSCVTNAPLTFPNALWLTRQGVRPDLQMCLCRSGRT
jgi:hypothetical protein